MVQRSEAIRDGAEGFFRTQYDTISKMAVLLALVILGIFVSKYNSPTRILRLRKGDICMYHCCCISSGGSMFRCCWVCWDVGISSCKCPSLQCCKTVSKRSIADSCPCWFFCLGVVGMAVIGIAILYAAFYVWLEVDSPGSMKSQICLFFSWDMVLELHLLPCLLNWVVEYIQKQLMSGQILLEK
ncbi:pyrophosphate-energized membrane proton pump 3-like [Hibiscus syriacus]|uniref:pyrophosphate-energized membrane proton pump 3-like n=1 Tax=Hibiscus syriacus TaxID=106335 RepID=UPI001921E909|nr:pyrophosphate-energized membrane proton pump 3-like [Hibiscus syriacus]